MGSWSTWDTSPGASMALCTRAHTTTRLEHRKVVPCTPMCGNGTPTQWSGGQRLSSLLVMVLFIRFFRKESDDAALWPFNQEFYLNLNMAVGGDWGGVHGVAESAFSGEGQIMEIDWVRIEQR